MILGLACLLTACGVQAGTTADFVGSRDWNVDESQFGGFSALEVADDGTSFTAITDSAWITSGRLLRGPNGEITGIEAAALAPLNNSRGRALHGDDSDAESMARLPDGALLVSFEGRVRIARYDTPDAPARLLPIPAGFRGLPSNKSLEAMAAGRDGTIWIVPEYDNSDEGYPVWRYRDGTWKAACRIPMPIAFHPSAADIGPDGRFYLLGRRLVGPLGFQSQVRRFDISDGCLTNDTLLFQSSVGQHDNLEGLSVWRDAAGDIRLTMISDDNFLSFQKTEFVEYRLREGLDDGVPIR